MGWNIKDVNPKCGPPHKPHQERTSHSSPYLHLLKLRFGVLPPPPRQGPVIKAPLSVALMGAGGTFRRYLVRGSHVMGCVHEGGVGALTLQCHSVFVSLFL